jgi:hypothetical protein
VIIGPDNSNVPSVMKLFADAFARSSIEVNSVVGQRMVLILKHVQVNFPNPQKISFSNFDFF